MINRKSPFYLEVEKGNVEGHSLIHKFGAGLITTTVAPITQLNKYQTPSTIKSLEFVSDSADDSASGSGAREITVYGLDINWQELIIVKATNGLTPVALGTDLFRVYKWYVSKSGSYATQSVGSHVGNLTIQEASGGATWDTIPISPMAVGRSQIGAYTIPKGKTGYLLGKLIFTDTTKTADVFFFKRENADVVTAPFTGIMQITEREIGVTGGFEHHFAAPKGGFIGPCDIGAMAKVSVGTAEISAEFELLLVDN